MTKEYKGFGEPPQESSQEPNFRRVLIGTPALDGKVDVWFADALTTSAKLCLANNINLLPVMLAYESILPMARNELIKIAYDEQVESLVFIDNDQAWNPVALLQVINSSYDVLGLPVVSKTDEPGKFNVNIGNPDSLQKDEEGNIKVESIGTGFLKLSRKALEALWNSNSFIEFRGKELKLICEYSSNYNSFVGEGITLCNKLKELDFDIWVNPNSTCAHIGTKTWMGDFAHFLNFITTPQE